MALTPDQPRDVERKLAAILSADVHGYSRMMAEDEVATVRMLTSSRELIGERVAQHRGRVVDSPGDNLLAEFPSAIDAVQCAIEVQRALMARNADLPPQRWMEFRIGIHLGDVMVEGQRIYGDGVNIAARLEGLAPPGGICISATVHEQVRGKLEADYDDIGAQQVKNIPRPVRALRIRMKPLVADGKSAPRSRRRIALASGAIAVLLAATVAAVLYLQRSRAPQLASQRPAPLAAAPTGKPSVAVLPFANLSADKGDEYFSDGMTDEIIGNLSKIAGLQVAARTSSFMFKGRNEEVGKIAGLLRVRNLLEGSVRRSSNKLRIEVDLIDATSGFSIWSERYDKDLADVFAIQSDVAERVAQKLKVALLPDVKVRVERKPTANLEAYNLYLQGRYYFLQFSEEGERRALECYDRAIAVDPHFALAYAGLANAYELAAVRYLRPRDAMPKAIEAARKALSIDSRIADASLSLAWALFSYDWDWVGAEREFKRALALDPDYGDTHQSYGWFLAAMGRYDEAIGEMERARELDPHWAPDVGLAYFWSRRYAQALTYFEQAIAMAPDFYRGYMLRGLTRAREGDLSGAVADLEKAAALEDTPTTKSVLGAIYPAVGRRAEAEQILSQLTELARRRYVDPSLLAVICFSLGDKDRAFEYYEKAYRERSPLLTQLGWPIYDPMRTEPRFIALYKKVGLPQ